MLLVVPADCSTLITNSGKWAHYAPGLVNKRVRFASLEGRDMHVT